MVERNSKNKELCKKVKQALMEKPLSRKEIGELTGISHNQMCSFITFMTYTLPEVWEDDDKKFGIGTYK